MKVTKAVLTISISFRPALNSSWDFFRFDTNEIFKTENGYNAPEEMADYHMFVRNLIEEAVIYCGESFLEKHKEFKINPHDFVFPEQRLILKEKDGFTIGIAYLIFKEKSFFPFADSDDIIQSMKKELEISEILANELCEELEIDIEDEILKNPEATDQDIFKLIPKVDFYFVEYPKEEFELCVQIN